MRLISTCRMAASASAALIAGFAAAGASAGPLVIPDVAYPRLAAHGASAAGFDTDAWRVESQAIGDLNGDGIPDLVMVLREHSPRNVLDNSGGLGPNSFDTNPRILVVAFGQASGGYDRVLANHALIPRPTEPTLDDYMSEGGGVAIKRGTLQVTLHLFASAGGWGMGVTSYGFRWRDGRFVLVGYDSRMVQRNTGDVDLVSIDYLTGRMKHTTGRADTNLDKAAWTTLPQRPLLSIDQVGDGMDFDPARPPL